MKKKPNQKKSELGKKDALNNPNKPTLSLIPKEALFEVGKALNYGAGHYGAHNWRKGLPVSVLLDAALRHIVQFADGEKYDQESKSHHLASAIANLSFAIWTEQHKPEMDDRWRKDD